MLTIMELKARPDGGHGIQSQGHRTSCWLDGWVAVPEHLQAQLWSCMGYCEPVLANGVLTGLKPTPRPPEPEPQPSALEQLRADVDYLAAMGGVAL